MTVILRIMFQIVLCLLQEAFLRRQATAPTDDLELPNLRQGEYQQLSSRLTSIHKVCSEL